LDGDGDDDLACVLANRDALALLAANVDPSARWALFDFALPTTATAVAAGEVNLEPGLDLVAFLARDRPAGLNEAAVQLVPGTRTVPPVLPLLPAPVPLVGATGRIAVGPLVDADYDDVAVVTDELDVLSILASLGGGDFAAPVVVTPAQAPRDVVLADLDGDGDLDAIVSLPSTGQIQIVERRGADFALGSVSLLTVGVVPLQIVVADVDDDLLPDLIVLDSSSDSLSFLRRW
jgi:hypothetical protein